MGSEMCIRDRSKDNKKTFNSFAVLEKNGLSVGDNETRIERIRSQIEDSIENPKNKSRYLPFRQSAIEQFVSKTIVSINKKNRENLWAIEVTTADRPGILAVIGDSFKKFDIEIEELQLYKDKLNAHLITKDSQIEGSSLWSINKAIELINSSLISEIDFLYNDI